MQVELKLDFHSNLLLRNDVNDEEFVLYKGDLVHKFQKETKREIQKRLYCDLKTLHDFEDKHTISMMRSVERNKRPDITYTLNVCQQHRTLNGPTFTRCPILTLDSRRYRLLIPIKQILL